MTLLVLALQVALANAPPTTPVSTLEDCAVLSAVARAEPFWGAGKTPSLRIWNDNGELRAACPWRDEGLGAPQDVDSSGGPLFWFAKPKIDPSGDQAREMFVEVTASAPPRTFYHACRLRRTSTGWTLLSPCVTTAARPAD